MELIPLRTSVFRPGSLAKELKAHNEFMIKNIVGGSPAPLSQVFDLNLYEWQSGGRKRPGSEPEPGGRVRPVGGMTPLGTRVNPVTGFYHSGLLLTYYFIHMDEKSDAAKLQNFVAASMRAKSSLANFEKEFQAYEKELQKFLDHPEVEVFPEGHYSYPSELTPPEPPEYPFGRIEDEAIRFASLDVLLEGRAKEEILKEAEAKLRSLDLTVSY